MHGETRMSKNNKRKMIISWLSISLSVIAFLFSSASLFYIYAQIPTGKPSFRIDSISMHSTYTTIEIRNNGTATAHNIRVHVIFAWGGPENTEFISELSPGRYVRVSIPLGKNAIEQTMDPEKIFVHVTCNEFGFASSSFEFPLV